MTRALLFAMALGSGCLPDRVARTFPEDPEHDFDGDGFTEVQGDCEDEDALAHPGAEEVCDGIDNDCNDLADDDASDATTWYEDADRDGYGLDEDFVVQCDAPSGFVASGGDCADSDDLVHPDAQEVCDGGTDNDCDGLADLDDPSMEGLATWYMDADQDGHGDPTIYQESCEGPTGWVLRGDDCDDADAGSYPDAQEVCDGADNDCDGLLDDDDPTMEGEGTWYRDEDGDDYGDPAQTTTACAAPVGYVGESGDCDDANPTANPASSEICDGEDDNCDGVVDEGVTTRYYRDSDGDGRGDPGADVDACAAPYLYVEDDLDCDDGDALAWTGATEACDGSDNDCDGSTDPEDSSGCADWFYDGDSDGYGTTTSRCLCASDGLYTATALGDCDDTDASVNPGTATCGIMGEVDGSEADGETSGGSAETVSGTGLYADYGAFGSAGDMDGDGVDDVFVGDLGYDSAYTNAGGAYEFNGPATGALRLGGSTNADLIFSPAVASTYAGASVSAGDTNGDGLGDFAVTAYQGSTAWVVLGPASGTVTEGGADATLSSFPSYVADFMGDVNGDGQEDLVTGAWGYTAYLFLGPVTGSLSSGAADKSWTSSLLVCYMGSDCLDGGDLDGDGVDDLAFGKWGSGSGGNAYVFFGNAGSVPASTPDVTWADDAYSYYGARTVDVAGDTDGDGYQDLLIADSESDVYDVYTGSLSAAGRAFLILGPVTASGSVSAADTIVAGEAYRDRVGWDAAGVGDVDADGMADVLVANLGVPSRLFYGPLDSGTADISSGDAEFSDALLYTEAAGDTNADGYDDLLVGSPTSASGYGPLYLYLGSAN